MPVENKNEREKEREIHMAPWASGIETAESSARGKYMPEGTHDVELLYGQTIPMRKGGYLIKAHVRVLASNAPNVRAEDELDVCYTLPAGDPDKVKMALGDIKNFIAALTEAKESEVTQVVTETVFDKDKNPCKGRKVRVVATNIETKAGGNFTKYVCERFNEDLHTSLKNAA